jgi:hypothetical protein
MTRLVVSSSKRLLILGLVLGIGVVGCHSRQGPVQPDQTYVRPETNGIDHRVAEAKRAGKTSVQIQISIQRAGVREIKEAFKHSEVITGTPIQSVVALNRDRNYVETWYKFRVDEDLSRRADINDSSPVPAEMGVPSTLLPLAKDQILVMGRGGTITVDGVLVKSTVADEPWVEMNRKISDLCTEFLRFIRHSE